jgi:hypothetical protein
MCLLLCPNAGKHPLKLHFSSASTLVPFLYVFNQRVAFTSLHPLVYLSLVWLLSDALKAGRH